MMIARCNDSIFADNIKLANTFFLKFKGLMGRKSLGFGEGLLLYNCSSIHCFFMKIPIDAVYLSKEMKVIDIETIFPWKIGRYIKGTRHTLELAAGATDGKVSIGDKLSFN